MLSDKQKIHSPSSKRSWMWFKMSHSSFVYVSEMMLSLQLFETILGFTSLLVVTSILSHLLSPSDFTKTRVSES